MPPALPSPVSREQLIEAVQKLMDCSGCVVDMDAMLLRLERHFPGVDIGQLIFNPPSGRLMSAAEIVDEGLQQSRERRSRHD